MSMRKTAERRHNDWRIAIRRKNILLDHNWEEEWMQPLHYYSKNKIWCNCWMCRHKTNNKKPQHRGYFPTMNWKKSDLRKLDSMKSQENEEQIFDNE